MFRFPLSLTVDGPAIVQGVALAALAAGLGIWGARLLAPAPQPLPPALEVSASHVIDTAPIAQWFGGGTLRVRVGALGVISAPGERGAALLTVDGASPRAYRVGQVLAPGVTLQAVEAAAVLIDQDGVVERLALPAQAPMGSSGFVRVPATGPSASPQP